MFPTGTHPSDHHRQTRGRSFPATMLQILERPRQAGVPAQARRRLPAIVVLLLALTPALLLAACGSGSSNGSGSIQPASSGRTTPLATIQPADAGKRLTVVATTTQLADFVHNVGGDRIDVIGLLAPNQDPHEYAPKPADVQHLDQADMVFKNGAGLERHWAKYLDEVPKSVPIVDTSAGVRLRTQEGEADPHIWHSPENAKIMVANIRDALERRDPDNSAYYEANAGQYMTDLDQLDATIRQDFTTVPPAQRKLVTNHDAFGYFVDLYGINFVGSIIPSGDTTAEPKPADTQKLLQALKDQHICAIFTESSINPKLEDQLAQDANVKVYSNLFGDTFGPPGSDGDTYLKMEISNTQNMIAGMSLSC